MSPVVQASPVMRSYEKFVRPETFSLLRVTNFNFPLQPQQKYYITQYEELGFSSLTQMKDECTTNSRYLSYAFSLSKVGRMYILSLEVKGLTEMK